MIIKFEFEHSLGPMVSMMSLRKVTSKNYLGYRFLPLRIMMMITVTAVQAWDTVTGSDVGACVKSQECKDCIYFRCRQPFAIILRAGAISWRTSWTSIQMYASRTGMLRVILNYLVLYA